MDDPSRKAFLATAAGAVGAAAVVPQATGATTTAASRRERAYRLRREAAEAYLHDPLPAVRDNGDEVRYADRRASFSKTLPHDELGHVEPAAYRALLAALASGASEAFEAIPRDPAGTARLNDPQATYSYELAGTDSYATHLAPPPAFASAQSAAEMVELYWLSLTLDVPFRAYAGDPLVAAAVADLRACSAPLRRDGARFDAATVFRGETRGDAVGPYLSQFLYADVPYGQTTIEQRYRSPLPGERFVATYAEWLACQRGVAPSAKTGFAAQRRYLATARDLTQYVHTDFSYQPYLNAALIALSYGSDALAPTNPYRRSKRQFGDITLGNKDVLTLLAQAALLGQKGSWYHKWQVHRRLRPEAFSGRVANHLAGRYRYDLHPDLLHSDALARTRAAQGSAILAAAYPEGCPTHPSYPAAHASNAGACGTVLKAFFDPDFVIPHPVEASADGSALEPYHGPLTLGDEIDKLCANVALGRDAAAVHYRSDGVRGLLLGEEQAIGLLRDVSRTYNERFDGFLVRRFDGSRVRIRNGRIG